MPKKPTLKVPNPDVLEFDADACINEARRLKKEIVGVSRLKRRLRDVEKRLTELAVGGELPFREPGDEATK